jgi:hypothetical protein
MNGLFGRKPVPQQPQITELNASTKAMTNHQRIIDRELQRAFDDGGEVMRLPTRSRLRRMRLSASEYKRRASAAGELKMPGGAQ